MTNNYESVDFDECRLRGASTFGNNLYFYQFNILNRIP